MVNLKISFFHKYILSQFVNSVHVAVDLYRLLCEVKLNIHNYSDLDQKQILPLSLSVVHLVIHAHVKRATDLVLGGYFRHIPKFSDVRFKWSTQN